MAGAMEEASSGRKSGDGVKHNQCQQIEKVHGTNCFSATFFRQLFGQNILVECIAQPFLGGI